MNGKLENGEPSAEEHAIDDVLDLQIISVHLQKKLIDNLKKISKEQHISYQSLIRKVLTHYVQDTLRNFRNSS